jgi:hypothetical protein
MLGLPFSGLFRAQAERIVVGSKDAHPHRLFPFTFRHLTFTFLQGR